MTDRPKIPLRVVLDQHGAYWRDFGDGFVSMCKNSTGNYPIEPLAVFAFAGSGSPWKACDRCHGGGGVIVPPGASKLTTCPACRGSGCKSREARDD